MTSAPSTVEELAAALPAGGAAYIDRDWLGAGAPPTVASALTFEPGAGLRWAGGAVYPASGDPDADAFRMLDALAGRVAAAAREAARGASASVSVPGDGLVASRIRARLPAARVTVGEPPAVVVETTGSAEGLQAACAAVADLGTIVLAVTPLGGTLAHDLYVDVHRRGLRVVGVPDPTAPDPTAPDPTASDSDPTDAGISAPATLERDEADVVPASAWLVLRA